MGGNEWLTADSWPPEGATQLKLYLSSGGSAATLEGGMPPTTGTACTGSG